ncbi:unnamed protein product [Arabidopsis arenosa]|uniref:Uncharacterized protein n=1 Tax=Arabidopsis arenosa TaxID=38785 RepID=A0A8S2ALN3_ARAAE|nr:unnamed protein product [Arabidopsis arenosa]
MAVSDDLPPPCVNDHVKRRSRKRRTIKKKQLEELISTAVRAAHVGKRQRVLHSLLRKPYNALRSLDICEAYLLTLVLLPNRRFRILLFLSKNGNPKISIINLEVMGGGEEVVDMAVVVVVEEEYGCSFHGLEARKCWQKLSVPPPLNLPSLRKEHERVDSSGSVSIPVEESLGVERDLLHLLLCLGCRTEGGSESEAEQTAGEDFSKEPRGVSGMSSSLVDMRPQTSLGVAGSGPLPLVRWPPRSDWADDERDTSHGLRDRDRDHGYSKNEPFWDRGFDHPRPHVLPQKHAAPSLFDKPGQREMKLQTRPSSRGREAAKKSNYILSSSRENVWNNSGAREAPYQHGGRQPWNNNMDSSSNRGTYNRDGYGIEHQNRDKRPFFKSDKPHVEDPFMKDFGDSAFDVHDPFPVLGVAKKKKEALKQTEFHDPVRESFEAELERVQKMQEEERRRIIEEQERVIELARTEEEERLRLAREQDERHRRLEEEAREAAFRNEQERLEATRRAEELRKSKEEEKHRLFMEEERRKQAAKQKLLELEEKISRRQAEAAKGCSSSSTISEDKFLDIVKEKESADVVDWEDSERMVDRITTSSTLDLSVPIRSFESSAMSQFSRDGSFGFPDRQKPTWRKEDIESGSNSRFIPQNMENAPHSPQEEFFGTAGYLSAPSYFKPGFPEHSVDQSWRIPGDGRTHGRNYGMESESRENFGEQYGDPGWGQSQGRPRHGPYSPYPEKLYQNPEGDDYYPFGRPRYSVRQPRVLPPPQESRQKASFRSEVEHPGPSTSIGGINYSHKGRTNSTVLANYIEDLQDHHVLPGSGIDEHHRFDSKLTGRCDSQSSLSVTSPPDSPVHLSHDDLDESADLSVLAASRMGEDTGLLEKGEAPIISSDTGKDSLMIATGSVSCWDNEEWTLDSNERLQEQEEYDEDEDGYQEEDKIHGVDENIDLAQELEEMHLEDKDSNLVLGFNEGVEVEIPSDDFEKCQRNSEATFPLHQHTVDSLDDERPSIETSRVEQAAQPADVSDPLSMHNASRSFQAAETTMQNMTIHPNSGRQSFEVGNKVDSTSNSTVSTHPVIPPHSTGLHPSLQTAIPPVSTSAQMEEPVKFQFGLFSGPSLIPSPFPAIQIGSIQMPLPLHPQFGSSLTHIQQPQSPVIQFGQLRYTSPISQGVLPPPHHSVVQANGLPTYALNQNPGSSVTVQLDQTNVSDGGTLKNVNLPPARASIEAAVSPQKQPELSVRNSGLRSSGTAEVSRVDSGGNRRYRRQRVEFRVRESNWPSSEENRNGNGRAQNSTKNGSRKYVVSNKSQKQPLDSSASGLNAMQKTSGIVRVFEQHGIEVPSDDDDFIEVRSKRQMLNDRREQREKEIKEKSQAAKAFRKPRSTFQKQYYCSQTLAPIGTPSPKTDSHADEKSGSNKSTQAIIHLWGLGGNQLTYQPVMALTQSQLDEAMKPVSLLHVFLLRMVLTELARQIRHQRLCAKEQYFFKQHKSNKFIACRGQIQFGAVTSSTVIPPCGGVRRMIALYILKKIINIENPSSTGMEICEAEAEAAASAIAVAAITNDETSGNALSTGSVLLVGSLVYQKAEESLIVSLPADLSVDTPISVWPQLPSPHNSNQMITHFPPGPPHYPFYDVNPMLRGPIFAFGPHHDAGATQSQSQKGPVTVSGLPTTWQQQNHPGVDSFYAPPAGFTGPFLTPPGAIPGVQGPPHMFVYNHFAPVGQFGGLSFMGTTYIPSGKQPDWKHNPDVSSSPVGGDSDVNNPNVASMQCNIVPASLQHLPMPMFDPSPFQEMPVEHGGLTCHFRVLQRCKCRNSRKQQMAPISITSVYNTASSSSSYRYPNVQASTVLDAMVDSSNAYSSTTCAPPAKPTTNLSDPNSNNIQNPNGPGFKPPQQQQQHNNNNNLLRRKNSQSQHVGGSSHHHQHQHQQKPEIRLPWKKPTHGQREEAFRITQRSSNLCG